MTLRPIRTKREHQAALKEIEALWEAPNGSPEADRLELLTLLVKMYEREHYPIEAPDPIDFLQHVMEARGMTRKTGTVHRLTRQGRRSTEPRAPTHVGDDTQARTGVETSGQCTDSRI